MSEACLRGGPIERATAWIHELVLMEEGRKQAAGGRWLLCALKEFKKSEFEHCFVGWLNGIAVQTKEQKVLVYLCCKS